MRGDDIGAEGETESTTGGETATTMSTAVPTSEGDTTAAPTSEGDTTAAPTSEGDTTENDTTEGDATEGDVTEGDVTEGANGPPQAVDDVLSTAQDTALAVGAVEGLLANDTDPDADGLTVTGFDAASTAGGTVVVAGDGGVDYIPAPGFWGTDQFDYTIEDRAGAAASATVSVFVAPTRIQLADVTGGLGGFVLQGESANDRSGVSVSAAGDVNGDGLADLVVGASAADPNGNSSGRAYVVFGKADTTAVELGAIAGGMGGFVLDGEVAGDFAGGSVRGAGDVNGDGMDDLIVGARAADPNGSISGRSYVVFGKADTAAVELGAIAGGVGGFVLDGEFEADVSGDSVSGAGDVNGDGMDDLIIGAPDADPTGTWSGRSYVVFGKADTALVELAEVSAGMGGFAMDGEGANDRSGESVSGAGDVNGDGMDDLIIGAHGADPNGSSSGRSYVVFGKADTAAVELSGIAAGMGGFALDGVIVGAPDATANGVASGRSYVVFGVPAIDP